jgi:HK97 family phage prohead protease
MHKSCHAKIKAAGTADGLADGQFRALVSVFGNVDSYGDKVMPGAFTNTLNEWAAKNEPIPMWWSHRLDDPEMNLGWIVDAQQTEQGLEVVGQFDLGEGASPKAATVQRLMKREGGVRDFSFSYDVRDGSMVKSDDGEEYFELRDLTLYEIGPTPIGANPATELLAVKRLADQAKSALDVVDGYKLGRVISAKNEETLRSALDASKSVHDAISNVLTSISSDAEKSTPTISSSTTTTTSTSPLVLSTTQKDRENGPVKSEEPVRVKGEEPHRRTPADWSTELEVIDLEGGSSWTI